ncbi:MAG: methyltransferase [Chloroflexota bacterium]
MPMKFYIDTHKGATFLFVLLLMAFFGRWDSPAAWLYLALHGVYGALWVLKSRIFPDRSWERPVSLAYGVGVVWGGLTLYWIAPVLLMLRDVQPPAWWLGLCAALYSLGVFTHFAADMQKHTVLALRPGLITDGMFARVRNPNYFGELLIYLGFGLLAMHWAPLLVIGLFVAFYWLPNMRRKDRSLSRYPGFESYRRRTQLLIPFLF